MDSSGSSFLSRVATAPISWGVCEVPGWGYQLSPARVLTEMSDLGFTHTELGSAGWLPEQTDELTGLLNQHSLSLLAAFIPLVLHDESHADAVLAEATTAAQLLEAAGASYFNTAPVTSVDWKPRYPLSDDEWQHLYRMVAKVDQICVDHGLIQVIHEHVGCVIETAVEVQALLDNTAARLVVDTGHLAIGGYSPIDLVGAHPDRVGLVHLKDTDMAVAEKLNNGELTLMEAVQAGLFTALGQGDLDIAEVLRLLETSGYRGWYVIEQDCALAAEPGPGTGPVSDVATSLEYLRMVADAMPSQPTEELSALNI